MPKREPYTGKDGEVRELDETFFTTAKRGRPRLPDAQKRRRVNVMLEPEVDRALKAAGGNMSERINRLLRVDLRLD